MTTLHPNHQFEPMETSDVPVPCWWRSTETDICEFMTTSRSCGHVEQWGSSAGRRPIYLYSAGQREDWLKGTANFNSALGSRQPESFWRRSERKTPVLCVIAGMHGHEVEGMVAAMSLICILETGNDVRGQPQPELAGKLEQLRVLIAPLLNPDGRARVPYNGFVGVSKREMTRVGQGTRRDGSSFGHKPCKAVHPMRGNGVRELGAYFDDDGVNMAHDEWFDPFGKFTPQLFRLARNEAPDMLVNLHSHSAPAQVHATAYVPWSVKREIHGFSVELRRRLRDKGLASSKPAPLVVDGADGCGIPSFNVNSALYHAGVHVPVIFESPHGLSDKPERYGYDEILDIHHIVFETAIDHILTSNSSATNALSSRGARSSGS